MTVTLANGKSGEFVPRGERQLQGRVRFRAGRGPDRSTLQGGLQARSERILSKGAVPMEHLGRAFGDTQTNPSQDGGLVGLACLPCAGGIGLMPKMAVMVEKEPFRGMSRLSSRRVKWCVRGRPAPAPAPFLKSNRLRRRREAATATGSCGGALPQPVQRQVETRVLPQAVQRDAQPVVETVRPQEQIQPKQEVVQVQASPLNRRRFTRRNRSCRRRRPKCSGKSRRWLSSRSWTRRQPRRRPIRRSPSSVRRRWWKRCQNQ